MGIWFSKGPVMMQKRPLRVTDFTPTYKTSCARCYGQHDGSTGQICSNIQPQVHDEQLAAVADLLTVELCYMLNSCACLLDSLGECIAAQLALKAQQGENRHKLVVPRL